MSKKSLRAVEPLQSKSLPSSDAAAKFLRGESGGTFELVTSTVLRSVLIAPGLVIAGVDGKKALLGSALSSVAITGFVLAYLKWGQPRSRSQQTRFKRSK